jgi:hypothetical protein
MFQPSENPLECTTQDEKDIDFNIILFITLYFDHHKK